MQFRTVTPYDIPQLLELMNNQYARQKTEKYFFWQYFNSFYPTIVICAEINDKIIGMFGMQKRRLTNGLIAGQAIDMLIHPEYRNQGIFLKLGEMALNYFTDLDFHFVLPNINGKKAILKNFEFKNLSMIKNLVLSKSDYNNSNYKLETHSIDNTYKFDYAKQVFHWRFTNHPDYSYTKIEMDDRHNAFVKIFIDPVTKKKYGDIVYFESSESTKLYKLIQRCCENLFSEKISIITTWALPNNIYNKVFKKIGFKEVIQERFFCLKTIKYNSDDLYNFNNWCLYQSDTEFY